MGIVGEFCLFVVVGWIVNIVLFSKDLLNVLGGFLGNLRGIHDGIDSLLPFSLPVVGNLWVFVHGVLDAIGVSSRTGKMLIESRFSPGGEVRKCDR